MCGLFVTTETPNQCVQLPGGTTVTQMTREALSPLSRFMVLFAAGRTGPQFAPIHCRLFQRTAGALHRGSIYAPSATDCCAPAQSTRLGQRASNRLYLRWMALGSLAADATSDRKQYRGSFAHRARTRVLRLPTARLRPPGAVRHGSGQ